jgi:hypothetical protein
MSKVISEDSARRSLQKLEQLGARSWQPDLEQMRHAESPLADAIDPDFLGKSPAELRLEAEVERLRGRLVVAQRGQPDSGASGGGFGGPQENKTADVSVRKIVEVEAERTPAVEARPSMEESRREHRDELRRRPEYR